MKASTYRPSIIPPFTEFTLVLTREEAIQLGLLCGFIAGELNPVRKLVNSIYYSVEDELKKEQVSLCIDGSNKDIKNQIKALSIKVIDL